MVVLDQVQTQGGPKLSVQAQMLPYTLDFIVHEKTVAFLDVSQVPMNLAQTWLVKSSRMFWDTCCLPATFTFCIFPAFRLS